MSNSTLTESIFNENYHASYYFVNFSKQKIVNDDKDLQKYKDAALSG